ncbi:hypothetical protein BDP55DRAFT_420883 [Colletotrichum godetiae]|uniref:Uncharacterized protein n=1 Tax=Colletotrichum godetiae TaxID=1209918 RepID=A0AAJ0A9R7_9PEZI|nr:uncharacterized protein BDP55DRAFT_420883 [Colletotrichum godetiae]KAK1657686.1 hypothetical protein BDP55DRAFT_420883 [Colletotrichum godetiae]
MLKTRTCLGEQAAHHTEEGIAASQRPHACAASPCFVAPGLDYIFCKRHTGLSLSSFKPNWFQFDRSSVGAPLGLDPILGRIDPFNATKCTAFRILQSALCRPASQAPNVPANRDWDDTRPRCVAAKHAFMLGDLDPGLVLCRGSTRFLCIFSCDGTANHPAMLLVDGKGTEYGTWTCQPGAKQGFCCRVSRGRYTPFRRGRRQQKQSHSNYRIRQSVRTRSFVGSNWS